MSERLALITATGREMRSVLPGAPRITPGQAVAWNWKGMGLYLAVCGMGPVNAAATAGRLLERRAELRGVLNLGIAGSFDLSSLPVLQNVLVREEIWPEFGLCTSRGVDPREIEGGQGLLDGEIVRDRVYLRPERYLPLMGGSYPLPWPEASSLTVAGMTGCGELADHYRQTHNPGMENMEGFALAWPFLKNGIPFTEIRCVCNPVGSMDKRDWDVRGALERLSSAFSTIMEGMNEASRVTGR